MKEKMIDIENEYFSYITAIQQEQQHQDLYYHKLTYGCQMNEHDSEKIAWICDECGYQETNNIDDADLIILNTC